MDWKKLITEIKDHFHLSNNELANRIGSTPSTIGNILNGKVDEPRKSFIRKLEQGFGIKLDFDNSTFQIQNAGTGEVLLPVIREQILGVLNMSYIQTHSVREESVHYHKQNNTFLMEVGSDTMAKTILPGDLVIIDLDENPSSGKTVYLILKDGTKFIGRLSVEGETTMLSFENTNYPPLIVRKDKTRSMAVIKKLIRNL